MPLQKYRDAITSEIKLSLGRPSTPLSKLDTMIEYHLGLTDVEGNPKARPKGKYLRPLLCLAMCGGMGAHLDRCYPVAAGLELTHKSTLAFDDIQDHGVIRNGDATLQSLWGPEQTINAGLALSAYARLSIHRAEQHGLPAEAVLFILSALERTVVRLCRGQYLDIALQKEPGVTAAQYLAMVNDKTASLFGLACRCGAICSGVHPERAAEAADFGESLGQAFQIWDDYLGIFGDEETIGKTANDLLERKKTFPIVLAFTRYRASMNQHYYQEPFGIDQANEIKEWLENTEIKEETELECRTLLDLAMSQLRSLRLDPIWERFLVRMINGLYNRSK